jgi:hypothetical protein
MKNAFGVKSFVFFKLISIIYFICLLMQLENVFASYSNGCKTELRKFYKGQNDCEYESQRWYVDHLRSSQEKENYKREQLQTCIQRYQKEYDQCLAEAESSQNSQGRASAASVGTSSNSDGAANTAGVTEKVTAIQNEMKEKGKIYECVATTETAKDECRLDKSDEMKAFLNFGQMMGALTQASGKQDESYCNKMKNMNDMASSGLSGFKLYCSNGYFACKKSCDSAKKFLNDNQVDHDVYNEAESQVLKASKTCGKLTGSLAEAASYIVVMVQNHANAKQCKQMLGKADNELCKMNKEFCDPLASLDCNNPQTAMTNLVCKCKANPNAEGCKGNVSGLSANNMVDPNGMADTAGLGAGAGKLPSAGGDVPEQYGFPFDGKPSEGKGANLSLGKGGHGGGGGIPAGGGNGAHPAGKPGPGGSNLNASILNGWQGGRGNQGGWGNTGGGWGDGKDKAAGGNGKNPYMTVDKNGNPVDLRQFLPGQNLDATRGIAGISGPDGITGPNSSLWKKIRVRYGSQRNFMP